MGNTHNRGNQEAIRNSILRSQRDKNTSQFSLSHFIGNLSGRSLVSLTSNQSVYSTSRPWSRVSRRRWNNSTLNNKLEGSKTAWPVSNKESIFLPEFPISTDLLQTDFELKEVIAKGAYGEVCRVKNKAADKDYALKILSKSQIVSENAVRQVKEEIRIQEVCGHHPFIVGAVSRWQTKKRLYIVTEYIPGGELLALLDKYKTLPEILVKVFIAEIAVALDFLHNAGVIYRDLKPENILLDSNLHVQLIDFGLSKWLTFGARTTTLCGTLKYMAPEVFSREPYGHAVDWWSLGVIACRMLTNEYPTPAVKEPFGEDVNEASNGHSSEQTIEELGSSKLSPGSLPVSSEDLSPGARGLLMRLLERDPKVRLRTLRQLQQSAFYLGYNFEHVKSRKIIPRLILEEHFGSQLPVSMQCNSELFEDFDQMCIK